MALDSKYRLELLGTVILRGPNRSIRASDHRQQRRRLALLSALACAGERGMSRDQLLLLFWPDSTQKKAKHSLDQLLYAIRTDLDESIFEGTNPIRLNGNAISSDVDEFNMRIAEGNLEQAVEAYKGAFLEGFYLSDTREFEEWADNQRRNHARTYENALEKLIQSLAKAGDAGRALSYGERYERDVRENAGTQRAADISELVSNLRTTPAVRLEPPITHSAPTTIDKRPGRSWTLSYAVVVSAILLAASAVFFDTRGTAAVRTVRRGTSNVAAYDLYLHAKDQVMMRNDSLAKIALSEFQQATELDPNFAGAYAGMATMYARLSMGNSPPVSRQELAARALVAARKAISLDDSLGEARTAIGLIQVYFLIDLDSAKAQLERAVDLDPDDSFAREYLAIVYVELGQPKKGIAIIREALTRNPLTPTMRASLALHEYIAGQCDRALPTIDSLLMMKPPLLRAANLKAICLASEGRWGEAALVLKQPHNIRANGLLGLVLANAGQHEESDKIRAKLRSLAESNQTVHFDISAISYALGDTADAFRELNKSIADGYLPIEVMGPLYKRFRSDPRFASIVASRHFGIILP